VVRDVPPSTVVAGVPAREIRHLGPADNPGVRAAAAMGAEGMDDL